MTASYPDAVWDGDSGNRNSDHGTQRSPDHRDWHRMIEEIIAIQKSNLGHDTENAAHSVGILENVAGLTVVERGNAAMHKTIFTLDEVQVTMTDGTTPSTDAMWGTKKLYTFPTGYLVIYGGHQVYPLGGIEAMVGGGAGLSDTADLEIGAGLEARSNLSNFILSGIHRQISMGQNGVDLVDKKSDALESSFLSNHKYLSSLTTSIASLNIITRDDDDAGPSPDTLKISGTITCIWSIQGND